MASRKATSKVESKAVAVAQLPIGTVLFADNTQPKAVVSGGTNWRIAAFIAANGSANRGALDSLNSHYGMGAYKSYHAKIASGYTFDMALDIMAHMAGANPAMQWVFGTTWGADALAAHLAKAIVATAVAVVEKPTTASNRKPTSRAKADAAPTVAPVNFVAYSDTAKATYGSDTAFVAYRPTLHALHAAHATVEQVEQVASLHGYYRKASSDLADARKNFGAMAAIVRLASEQADNAAIEIATGEQPIIEVE